MLLCRAILPPLLLIFVSNWVRVYTADNPPEAVFIRGLLEAEGIPVRLKSMELWAAAVEIYFAEGARPSVWVPEKARWEAERVLAQRDRSGTGKAWTCRCGERLDGQFTVCWRCGAARPEHE
ncbi:MAG: DUF2007 domain-containing protein [Wenzhouxiangella sp.]|nr:MAG: DUF2007 domain-containing protein [Wenzhouxiangella sp.]